MSIPVHLLVTCRSEELLPASTMIFQSLRVGFPTANVTAWLNCAPTTAIFDLLGETAKKAGCQTGVNFAKNIPVSDPVWVHHAWIRDLINHEKHGQEPFWILDTDVMLWDNFEQFDFSGFHLAGRFTPRFFCRFANALTQSRLHSCLLYIDPVKVREKVKKWGERFPDTYCTPRPTIEDLVFPRYLPINGDYFQEVVFFDTCCLLFQTIGGTPFNEEQNLRFDHCNFGTISDLIAPYYPDELFRAKHFAIFENPQLLKGAWIEQQNWYRSHQ